MSDSTLYRLTTALEGRYRVDRELGAGGMATVYLAHDLRHERDVAIKVLHPDLGAALGADRFLAEIKTTAKLQHPHILPLLDSGAADGLLYYVMPYVRGETLRARLERERQLPIPDAIRIAREVAGALDHAHKQGIIHRDIKPENILLQDGAAVVADFGIALAVQQAGGQRMTQTGLSLGTPQYMSPEQAMGEKAIDARTDIYALGAVTYEILAGEPPFSGPSTQAIVAKVLSERPVSLTVVRDTTPPAVDAAVQRALAKLAADRPASAANYAEALESGGAESARPLATAPKKRWPLVPMIGASVGTAVALLGVSTWLGLGRVDANHTLELGQLRHVTWERDLEVTPALSPDGQQVVYAGGRLTALRVMVRSVNEGRPVPLTGDTTSVESDPQWSPDGTRILFLSRGGVYSAPSGGGPPRPEVNASGPAPVTSAAWAPDGRRIVFTRSDSLLITAEDGTSRRLTTLVDPSLCRWSPDGDWIACTTRNAAWSTASNDFGNSSASRIVLVQTATGRTITVTDSTSQNVSPTWARDGASLYFLSNRDGEFDVYGVRTDDAAAGRAQAARISTGLGAHTIDLARNGSRLVISRYANRNRAWALPLPSTGAITSTAAKPITNASETIESFGVDPAGQWLVYDSNRSGSFDLFKVRTAGGEPVRLTNAPGNEFAPTFTSDGQSIVFHARRDGNRELYRIPADGGPEERLTRTASEEANAAIAPDGKAIATQLLGARQGIELLGTDAAGAWTVVRTRLERAYRPSWSPDGRLVGFLARPDDGAWRVIPTDSGSPRVVYDGRPGSGNPPALAASWSAEGPAYLLVATDARQQILEMDPAVWKPVVRVNFDPSLHVAYTRVFRVVRRVLYFITESRESDVWVFEVNSR